MEAWGFYTGRFEFNGRQVAPGKASSIKTKQNSLGLKSVKTRRESILIEKKKNVYSQFPFHDNLEGVQF